VARRPAGQRSVPGRPDAGHARRPGPCGNSGLEPGHGNSRGSREGRGGDQARGPRDPASGRAGSGRDARRHPVDVGTAEPDVSLRNGELPVRRDGDRPRAGRSRRSRNGTSGRSPNAPSASARGTGDPSPARCAWRPPSTSSWTPRRASHPARTAGRQTWTVDHSAGHVPGPAGTRRAQDVCAARGLGHCGHHHRNRSDSAARRPLLPLPGERGGCLGNRSDRHAVPRPSGCSGTGCPQARQVTKEPAKPARAGLVLTRQCPDDSEGQEEAGK